MKKTFLLILGLLLGVQSYAQVIPGGGTVAPGPSSSIIGNLQTATGGKVTNGTLTFSLSQPAVVSGSSTLVGSSVSCYTSSTGNIVGLPDPTALPVVNTTTAAGTLPAGAYYVKYAYIGANGTSLASPELTVGLDAQGSLAVTAPAIQPTAATGFYAVYIGTSPGAETLQGIATGWTLFSQNSPLVAGSPVPAANTSSCNVYLSDELIPTGTYYTVSLTNKNGAKIAGFPQTWCTYGGQNATIDVSNGAPTGNCGTNGVFYPTPTFANPQNNSPQSISGPIAFPGGIFGPVSASGPWTFSSPTSVTTLNNIQFADQYANTQTAINALPPTGGTVYFAASPLSYICPTSIPSNVALVGLSSFADSTYIGNIGILPVNTQTQVKIGPCSNISIASSAQNIRLQNLTIDFANSGRGLTLTNVSGVQLEGVSIINAGNNSTPALSWISTTQNVAANVMDHVTIVCNITTYCKAGVYLKGNVSTPSFVTNNNFSDIAISGALLCGIDLEANSDTNNWFGGRINPSSLTANSAAFCFNLENAGSDVDVVANFFMGWSATGNTTYVWNAGESSGMVFLFLNTPPPPANFNVAGGNPIRPTIITSNLGPSGRVTYQSDIFNVQGNEAFLETNAPSGVAGSEVCYGNSSLHTLQCSYNAGTFTSMTQTIGSGNVTTAGTLIAGGACQPQTGITVTNAATTDNVVANIGSTLPATWQTGIQLSAHVTAANTVTVYLCNPTAGNITPAATAVNVRVTR